MRRFLFYFATAPFYVLGIAVAIGWESAINGWHTAQFWLDETFHPDDEAA